MIFIDVCLEKGEDIWGRSRYLVSGCEAQRKMSCAGSWKEKYVQGQFLTEVLEIDLLQNLKSAVVCSMIVMKLNSHCRRPGLIPQRSQINYDFLPPKRLATKLVCGYNGAGRSQRYV